MKQTTELGISHLCMMLHRNQKIVWIEPKRIKFRGSKAPQSIEYDLFFRVIKEEGLVINEQEYIFNPKHPPKFLWFKNDTRFYLTDFTSAIAYYYKYEDALLFLNLQGEPQLGQEVLHSRIACSRLHNILRYYGFMRINQHSLINICNYQVTQSEPSIRYTIAHQQIHAVNIVKGHLKADFMYAQVIRILSYIETHHGDKFYALLDELPSNDAFWDILERYLNRHKQEFHFLPPHFMRTLDTWRINERRKIERKAPNFKPISNMILDIIDYHRRYHELYFVWIFDGFVANPQLHISRLCVQKKEELFAQKARGDFYHQSIVP